MAQRPTRADATDKDEAEQPPSKSTDPRIAMSREEIEAFRAKLQALYHEP